MTPKVVLWKGDVMVWWWRMKVPSFHLNMKGWDTRLVEADGHEFLQDSDVVMAQRIVAPQRFEILQKLKELGKRIVLDIDDDLFSIPQEHPVFERSQSWDINALVDSAKLADVVTTTTEPLRQTIREFTGVDSVVIPNALDFDDPMWPTVDDSGSKDNLRRIYWQGTGTHDLDWRECLEVVDEIMVSRKDIRLVIWGGVPRDLMVLGMENYWLDRLQGYLFVRPENYFDLMTRVFADVALAPIQSIPFNESKSQAKFVEYTLTGIPTVASNVGPYADAIEDGRSGILASSPNEWRNGILSLLDDENRRKEMLTFAREVVRERFNIHKTLKDWERIFNDN